MSNYHNYSSVIDQITEFGLIVNKLDVDRLSTKRVAVDPAKCPVDAEKRKFAGWYKLSSFSVDGKTFIVGSYGYWKGTDNNAQKVEWKSEWSSNITPEQRQAMADAHKAAMKKAEADRSFEINRASDTATLDFAKCYKTGESAYLARKGVDAFGVRFSPSGAIAVPLCDIKGKIFALQIIRDKQKKTKKTLQPEKQFYPTGCSISGKFHIIGSLFGASHALIAEGYATGATLHQATGLPVVVAFNANNLTPVAKEIHKEHPFVKLVVCADDDYLTIGNPGVTHAQNAALSVGGQWVKPSFVSNGVDFRDGEKLTDFNDLHCHPKGGLALVSFQILSTIKGFTEKTLSIVPVNSNKLESFGSFKSIIELDEAVMRFIPLIDGTGKYLFDTEIKKIVLKEQLMSLLEAKSRFDDIKKHPIWKERGAYSVDQVGFDPSGKDHECKLNTFNGWKIIPAQLDDPIQGCKYLLDTLRHLCSGESNDKDVFSWVLNWLAYPLQNPGAKMQSAVVVHGPQGTGKSLFFEAVGKIYGEYSMVLSQGAIEDKFNSDWTSRKLFIIADEIVARQDMYHIKNQLKGLITGEYVRVNPKNLIAYKERNQMNLVFLSNEKQPVILEDDDRRHCVIFTPEKREDFYFDFVSEEISNGGIEALYQFLLARDLADFKPWTKPPMTASKQDLIDLGKDSIQIFIDKWKSGELDLPVGPVIGTDLYDAYQRWCKRSGEYEQKERFMNNFIDKVNYLERIIRNIYVGSVRKTARLVMPSGVFMSEAVKNGAFVLGKEESETESMWMTRSVENFRKIKNGD